MDFIAPLLTTGFTALLLVLTADEVHSWIESRDAAKHAWWTVFLFAATTGGATATLIILGAGTTAIMATALISIAVAEFAVIAMCVQAILTRRTQTR